MVGDILELAAGPLRICKYVGFEEARWFVPESPVTMAPVVTSEMTRNAVQPEPAAAQI